MLAIAKHWILHYYVVVLVWQSKHVLIYVNNLISFLLVSYCLCVSPCHVPDIVASKWSKLRFKRLIWWSHGVLCLDLLVRVIFGEDVCCGISCLHVIILWFSDYLVFKILCIQISPKFSWGWLRVRWLKIKFGRPDGLPPLALPCSFHLFPLNRPRRDKARKHRHWCQPLPTTGLWQEI